MTPREPIADTEDARWFQSNPARRYRARPLIKSELAEVRFPYEFAHDAFAYAVVPHGKLFLTRYYLAMPALRQIDDNDDVVGEIFRQVERAVVERYASEVIAREIAEESA
jgi:hypothetical protein